MTAVCTTILQRLRASGLTPTGARIGVLQVLADEAPRRLHSEEIFREMRRRGMRTSLSTVYRVAQKLYAVGMLRREMDDTGKVHYRLQPADTDARGVRLICRRSGQSVLLEDAQLHAGLIAAAARQGLNVTGQTLVLEVHAL